MKNLWHGTSVGWLAQPGEKFEFEKCQFGETSTPLPLIWLAELRSGAENAAYSAFNCVQQKINDPASGINLNDFTKCPPGAFLYEIAISKSAVCFDLNRKKLETTVTKWAFFYGLLMSRNRSLLSFIEFIIETTLWLCGKTKWQDLFKYETADEGITDQERWVRLSKFCKAAGIHVLINPVERNCHNGYGEVSALMQLSIDKEQKIPSYQILNCTPL